MDASPRRTRCPRIARRRTIRILNALGGLCALVWLVLRSGTKPSRITYPCQQAALSTASLAFGASVVAALVALRRRVGSRRTGPLALALGGLAVVATLFAWGWVQRPPAYAGPILETPADYAGQVFHVSGCPRDPEGDRFPGLDDLIELMGGHGLKFYRSETASLVSGPEGIVGPDDVIVIKINYQWPERGGTNTDLLRGLIRRIVDHPDGFSGEVIVGENAQFRSTEGMDRAENNAQDVAQSPHDVVTDFRNAGHRVSHYDWTPIRTTAVDEYSTGDMLDGYVVGPWDSTVFGRLSYPKFQSDFGTRVSLRYGVWTEGVGYDRARLKYINVPVLKSHHSTYGATVTVKNYMGTVTGELGTNSHLAISQGILGKLMVDIGLADLNLLDCIWINADPNSGPATTYEQATRRDELVAGVDPIAADMWAVKNILIPAFEDNGHSPPWPTPSADPDDPSSAFRGYIDASMYHLLDGGYDVTNDFSQIDEVATLPPGEASQPGRGGAPFRVDRVQDGYQLSWSTPVRGGEVVEYNLYRTALGTGGGPASPECEAALGGGSTAFLTTLPDDHGFLVVARNGVGDGSFGSDSAGRERPSPAPESVCP